MATLGAAGASAEANENLRWILCWLVEPQLEREELHRLANNFQFGLFEKLENDVVIGTQLELMRSVSRALQRLVEADPTNADWQRDLSRSHSRIGDLRRAQGGLL